jgi:hypothetical protein
MRYMPYYHASPLERALHMLIEAVFEVVVVQQVFHAILLKQLLSQILVSSKPYYLEN